jgi:hypothetical protein
MFVSSECLTLTQPSLSKVCSKSPNHLMCNITHFFGKDMPKEYISQVKSELFHIAAKTNTRNSITTKEAV